LRFGDGRVATIGATHAHEGGCVLGSCGLHGSVDAVDAIKYVYGDLWRVWIDVELERPDTVCGSSRVYIGKVSMAGVVGEWVAWCLDRSRYYRDVAISNADACPDDDPDKARLVELSLAQQAKHSAACSYIEGGHSASAASAAAEVVAVGTCEAIGGDCSGIWQSEMLAQSSEFLRLVMLAPHEGVLE
jgi:hypothetical protein